MEKFESGIQLVQCVQNYPVVYDSNAIGYHNKAEQDKAWQEIANNVNLPVSECKERWKNLRASLSRYIRNQHNILNGSENRSVKPYYMAEYMSFLIPFCKQKKKRQNFLSPEKNTGNIILPETDSHKKDSQLFSDTFIEETLQEKIVAQKCEPYWDPELPLSSENNSENCDKNVDNIYIEEFPIKRHLDEMELQEQKKQKLCDENTDADLNFLKSLLPDIQQMSRKQKNRLKIEFINIIENILNSSYN